MAVSWNEEQTWRWPARPFYIRASADSAQFAPGTAPRGERPNASASAQRLDDHNLVGGAQRLRQIEHLFAVDEKADMGPHAVLLVDHAKADARELAVQVRFFVNGKKVFEDRKSTRLN